jgi:hypothetical protein
MRKQSKAMVTDIVITVAPLETHVTVPWAMAPLAVASIANNTVLLLYLMHD